MGAWVYWSGGSSPMAVAVLIGGRKYVSFVVLVRTLSDLDRDTACWNIAEYLVHAADLCNHTTILYYTTLADTVAVLYHLTKHYLKSFFFFKQKTAYEI